jgi:hypothetical protein
LGFGILAALILLFFFHPARETRKSPETGAFDPDLAGAV